MPDLVPARTLMDAALRDMRALTGMLNEDVFANEVFGLHVQQAVEKSLKAWIAGLGELYLYTHDLSILLRQLEELGCEIDSYKYFIPFSSFATQVRYEGADDDAAIERKSALKQVQLLYESVDAILCQKEEATRQETES